VTEANWWDLPPNEAMNIAILWAEDLPDAARRAKIVVDRLCLELDQERKTRAELGRLIGALGRAGGVPT
jgi:hypothetical protein